MAQNITILQQFHWYTPNDGNWWNFCGSEAKNLANKGITHVYLPPAYKSGMGNNEPGYAVYDLYDLGEFDQKGTVRTKYGTKQEYLDCIKLHHQNNINILADIVLNHRVGGDEVETFTAIEVDEIDRNSFINKALEIESFTRFCFPARNKKYSEFEWNFTMFTGVDNIVDGLHKIYIIQNKYGDKWEELTDNELGNFDYLIGADVEYRNEIVRKEIINWGIWYVETTGIDGFRMDALKHISPHFIKEWINSLKAHFKKDFFIIGEFWNSNTEILAKYLDEVEETTQILDIALHYNFAQASAQKNEYDLSKIFDGTLVNKCPSMSITFVDNHDTQPLQSLESPVEDWFKPLAYALILLRESGIPLIFNPCFYGANYTGEKEGNKYEINIQKVEMLDKLLYARKQFAYGTERNYFDHFNTIGWVRDGLEEVENSGCAILITNGSVGFKDMDVNKKNAGKKYYDITENIKEEVIINEDGIGTFLVKENSVSVWVLVN